MLGETTHYGDTMNTKEVVSKKVDGAALLKEAVSKELAYFELPVRSVTVMNDPVDAGAKHYYAFVPARNVPNRIKHFNVRTPNIGGRLYKKVVADLMLSSKAFHLNNRGIIILADKVDIKGKTLVIDLGKNGGIMDGGRTDRILRENGADAPDTQHVFVQIRTGVPGARHTDMAMGLNTSAQVQKESLLNFDGFFDEIKEAVAKQPYADKISWEEGDKKSQPVSVVDIIRYITAMNIEIWPIKAYSIKKKTQLGITVKAASPVLAKAGTNDLLKLFESHDKLFENMYPLIPEILLLRDYIESNAILVYNGGSDGTEEKRGSYLGFVTANKNKKAQVFSGNKTYYTLTDAAILLLLGAMRVTLKQKASGEIVFDGGLEKAKATFDKVAYELINVIAMRTKGMGKKTVKTFLDKESRREDFWDAMLSKAVALSQ